MRLFSLRQFSVLASLTAVAVLSAGALLAAANAEAPAIGAPAPAFTAVDTNGVEHSLSDFADKTVVLEWTNHDCPFVVKHYDAEHANMQNHQTWGDDVVWLSIISSAPGKQGHVSAEQANELTTSRGAAPDHVIIDESGDIGRLYDAKTTPHMFVIDADGMITYDGAIDSIKSARTSDIPKAAQYVEIALDAMANGEEIEVASSTPYGCSVKY